MGRMGTPEEVADVVAYLFRSVKDLCSGSYCNWLTYNRSDEARYVTGSIVEVNGGRT